MLIGDQSAPPRSSPTLLAVCTAVSWRLTVRGDLRHCTLRGVRDGRQGQDSRLRIASFEPLSLMFWVAGVSGGVRDSRCSVDILVARQESGLDPPPTGLQRHGGRGDAVWCSGKPL